MNGIKLISNLTLFCFLLGIAGLINSCKTNKKLMSKDSVNAFGANGEDKKDDTFAFLKAFGSNSDSLFLDEGTYYIHASKLNKALIGNKVIEGQGKVSIIDLDHSVFLLLTNQNVTIRNIHFQSFRVALSLMPANNINCIIENCSFSGDMRFGISSSVKAPGSVSLSVDHCTFDGKGKSPEPKSRGGIWLNSKVNEVHIKNSTFKNFSSNKMARAIAVSPKNKQGKFIHIENNTIENIHANQNSEIHGILVFGEKAIITKNTLSNISASTLPSNDCEGIYTKVKDLEISDNTLKDAGNSEGAIVVKTFNKNVTPKSLISGNKIEFTNQKNTKASGIVVRYPQNSTIRNNLISNSTFVGIEITGSGSSLSNLIVSDNKVIKSSDAGILLVSSDGTASNIVINKNIIDGANAQGEKKEFSPLRVVTGDTENQKLRDLNITNNTIKNTKNCEADILIQSRFAKHQIEKIRIENNHLESNAQYKILFHTKDKKSTIGKGKIDNVIMKGNTYSNNKKTVLKNKKLVPKLKEQEN